MVRGETVRRALAALFGLVLAGAATAWVVLEGVQGRMTAGELAMFFAAFRQGQGLARSLLQNASQIYTNGLFLANLFEFLALGTEPASISTPPATGPVVTPARGVRFESVTFQYPETPAPALSDFTLHVPAGQTAAIVGPNGAGKSTVVKLLCRFYEPDRGRILIDGVDIRDRAPADVRRLLSVLLQDPVRYAATVEENVEPDRDPHAKRPLDRAAVERAVRAAGAEAIVSRLPRGFDTLLGKWFEGGTELSGGEWQRLALARALAREAPILLLDEPTSAMDSWAEGEWFERLKQAAAGRTTIIITHRFTTAKQADVIHVMQDGRIIESGSHDELVARGGRYAESWARHVPRSRERHGRLNASWQQ
jgi:ATP-binding cassette subfamily B protein